MKYKIPLVLCLYSSIVYPVKLQRKMLSRHSLKSIAKQALVGGTATWVSLSAFFLAMDRLIEGSNAGDEAVFIVASGILGVPVGVICASIIGTFKCLECTYNRVINVILQHQLKKMLAGSTVTYMEYNQAIELHNQLFAFQDLKWLSKEDYADLIAIIDKLEKIIDEMGLTLEKNNK